MTPASQVDRTQRFETHRRFLRGLAYRFLGSVAEAEDVVQDTYLRWHGADAGAIRDDRAYLSRVATRICLDRLKSARMRRETYVGPWLPEPVVDDELGGRDSAGDIALDLSVALMLALERLTPLERAAFLLHDVFDVDFADVAEALNRSPAACRQLAARARRHVRAARPRYDVPAEDQGRIRDAFMAAVASGDAKTLTKLLAEDAILHSDGGGNVPASLKPVVGASKIAHFYETVARKAAAAMKTWPARINGLPGFVALDGADVLQTLALQIDHGRVTAIYTVRNPEKLRHIAYEEAGGIYSRM